MERTSQLFKAMGDPTRLRILSLLTRGELCVCEIEASLSLPQSTVSRHLSFLKNVNLVCGRRKGVWMFYSLREPGSVMHQAVLSLVRGQLVLVPEIKEFLDGLARPGKNQSASDCCQPERTP